MPVLLGTLLLALSSQSFQHFLEETFSFLAVICAERLWELLGVTVMVSVASYVLVNARRFIKGGGAKSAEMELEEEEFAKQPVAPGAMSEALSGAAGIAFTTAAYTLLLSEHRFKFSHAGREATPYLERLVEINPTQLLSMVTLSLSFVVLLGCAGMTLALDDTDMPRLSRLDAYCVVGLVVQACFVIWLVGLQTWYFFTGQAQFDHAWNGLLWGLFFAGFGQVLIIIYHFCRSELGWFRFGAELIQPDRPSKKQETFYQQMIHHIFQPSAFALMGFYLIGIWKASLMPESYYQEDASVDWFHVLLQLLVVDVFTVINHMGEHSLASLYIASHKSHHRFVSPTLFDAFDGSLLDTVLLILFPLFCTCRTLTFVNTWSYIAFGFVYSTHFMLIHSEWPHFLDSVATKLAIYTANDHHVHHARFVYNYAHFFTFWDRALGTYREHV